MKEIVGSHGEKELQMPEHVPIGPVRIAEIDIEPIKRRLDVLEAQVKSLQMQMRTGVK